MKISDLITEASSDGDLLAMISKAKGQKEVRPSLDTESSRAPRA